MANVSIKPIELEQAAREFDKIVGKLNTLSGQVNFVKGCLTPFSGFGIKDVIGTLERLDGNLDLYRSDLVAERDSLRKIIELSQNCDNEIGRIFSGRKVDNLISNSAIDGTASNSIFKSLAEWYSKFFDSIAGDMDLIDYIDFVDKSISLILKLDEQPDSPPFWSAIKYGYDIMDFYRKGGYDNPEWLADGLSITKDTFSLSKDVLELFDGLGLIKDEKLVENASPYFTWIKIALSTVVKGVKSYNEHNEDGKITSDEKWDIVFDVETAALSSVVAAFLSTLHPAAGAAYSYADSTFDLSGKLSDAIQNWAPTEAERINETVNNSGEFTDFYNKQNPATQAVIRFLLTNYGYRAIIKCVYQ